MGQTAAKSVKLYVVEDQEIYREVYKTIATSTEAVELLKVASNENTGSLLRAVTEFYPDVILLSTKKLETSNIEELEKIRTDYPKIGIVLLLMFYSVQDIELLRRLALRG